MIVLALGLFGLIDSGILLLAPVSMSLLVGGALMTAGPETLMTVLDQLPALNINHS
jgi:hypothetical protein